MNGKKVMLTIQGEKKEYPAGTSFLRIAQDYSDAYQDDIVLVLYNRRLRELNKCADGDGTVEFLTTADKTGKKAYRRSVTLLSRRQSIISGKREYIGACKILHRTGKLL